MGLQCSKCQKGLSRATDVTRTNINGMDVIVVNGGEFYCRVKMRPLTLLDIPYNRLANLSLYKILRRSLRAGSPAECADCFNESVREMRREEERRREELNQRLQDSLQRATEQQEKQSVSVSEESRSNVLIKHLDEFEANCDSDGDELLKIISLRCCMPLPNLCVTQLTGDQLLEIMSVLDQLLFDDWLNALPPLSTLQDTQVFITELYAFSLKAPESVSLLNISNYLQSLLEFISQSTCNAFENLLLAQSLYQNLVHLFSDSCDTDAVLVAKRWAEGELSFEQLFPVEFLGTLASSLQKVVEKESLFILKMEIQCLKLLLSTLTHLNSEEMHSKSSDLLLRLVHTNQWTPTEAMNLLRVLSQEYTEDVQISEFLTLVRVYNISPLWRDKFGRSLTEALDSAGSERFPQDFKQVLRDTDERGLEESLADLKRLRNLDDSVIDVIKNITLGVLKYSAKTEGDAAFRKESITHVTLNPDVMQKALCHLCNAVFDTKGWWPTVTQMLRWCVMMLTESSGVLQLVGVQEDPCVTAMFVATQVYMGNKLDIVLTSDSVEQTEEWSDFYKHLGISLITNMKKTDPLSRDIYDADVVYGTMDDFVSDYFQHGIEAVEGGNPHLSRGFIIEEQSLSSSHNLEFSRLKNSSSLGFAADVLQNLMSKFHTADLDVRLFVKMLFQVLHTSLDNNTNTDNTIITILKKIIGRPLPSHEIFILTFLENFLRVITEETGGEKNGTSPAGSWCFQTLFACLQQLQSSKEETKELLQLVSNLEAQRLWSPVEVLNLLAVLTDLHHDEGCISIMKILHLIKTYQVSSKWTDEDNQSLLKLLDTPATENLIQCLEKSLRGEATQSIDTLFHEIRQKKDIDEHTLGKLCSVVTHVTNLINTGEIKKHTNVKRARILSHSTDTKDLQQLLAVLCNAVHLHTAEGMWWPRATQMISLCLLALSDTGKLLEMGTGEGKSCVIAMFAAMRALRGEKVDVMSSSSILCQRDAKEWSNFYEYLGVTVDTNTNKTEDKERKQCYEQDVVYGTVEAFAADHLRQIFEMKDVRPNRKFQCIIIDEVDSLLLDQGVERTYLSSPIASMQHLNIILVMIWSHVRQYGFLSTGHKTFIHSARASFFKAIFDSINTEDTEIKDPMDILKIAEENKTVPEGFTEDLCKSEMNELLTKLKAVGQEAVVDFFKKIEAYIPYGFTVYTLENGLLRLRKRSPYINQDIPELTFLVLEDGFCCTLYESEESLVKLIAELISSKIQYTTCENKDDKISIPGFLNNLIEKKMPVWVQNAFVANQMMEGREYVVENDIVRPVDFRSTGVVEINKKWGDGLQQFVEIKHQIKMSTISTVTNYISNVSLLQMYNGNIYGTTGTLGCETDILFLKELYPDLSTCRVPTFNRKCLSETPGTLMTTAEEWKSEIKRVVLAQISPNAYRGGRAALVICESINKAEEIYNTLEGNIPGALSRYCHSDRDRIDKELGPGDVIIATNLAGRGTDIKVSEKVNNNGGLLVILSFLSVNTRVELQAFGRTARKGNPGSAQIIMSREHLQQTFGTASSLEEVKNTRDKLAEEERKNKTTEVTQMKLCEELFSEYLKTLQDIHSNTDGDEKRAVVAIMNEVWAIWLQTKSEEIDELKRDELLKSLKAYLSLAKSQSQSQTSPISNIYHYVHFGNIALSEDKWDVSIRLFEKAMEQDKSWAAIAFYSHAYCTIKQQKADYLTTATDDLTKANESLKYLIDESMIALHFIKISSADSDNSNPTSLEQMFINRCSVLRFLQNNICETLQKLEEIKARKKDAVANKSHLCSLVSGADDALQLEASNLFSQGLKYVFSVEVQPCFQWGALLVLGIGVLQIVGGALLITFTYGTLSQIGLSLIIEGISDCIHGIMSLVTAEFSLKSWAQGKAISIVTSIVMFGVAHLIAKGFNTSKSLLSIGQKMNTMPKFLSNQAKEGLSIVAKENLKNTCTHVVKKMAEEVIIYGVGRVEEAIITGIMNNIKDRVTKGVAENVKSNMKEECMAKLVDFIILSQLQDKRQLGHLLEDVNGKRKLMDIFKQLSKAAVQPFYVHLGWQNKLFMSVSTVIDKVKAEVKGKTQKVLNAIKLIYVGSIAAEAVYIALNLSSSFFSNLCAELKNFKKGNKQFSETVNVNELTPSETEMLNGFKQDLVDTISALVAETMVEVIHKKFTSHIVSHVQGKVNGIIRSRVRHEKFLDSVRTEELIKAGENNRYIKHMPGNLNSIQTEEAGQHIQSHARNITDPMTPGTIFDIRVLSENTGTRVVILTPDRHGKLVKMQEINPGTKPASQTVTLIYTPKSAKHQEAHYDVCLNNQRVNIFNDDKGCLFHAFAKGMNPEANVTLEAAQLRATVAHSLQRNPNQWEPFVKRRLRTESIRGGDWFMTVGAAPERQIETREVLERYVGKIGMYKQLRKYDNQNAGIGHFINADHQPPVNCIVQALVRNQNSKLAKGFLEVGTGSSPLDTNQISKVHKGHGLLLPATYVPGEVHREFPSSKSKAYRTCLTECISKDDVVGAFKVTFLGSMPRCMLSSNSNFNNFQNNPTSQTRLDVFKESFQSHSIKMVETWYDLLKDKDAMTHKDFTTITTWIENKGYNDQNDPHRNEVSNLLSRQNPTNNSNQTWR